MTFSHSAFLPSTPFSTFISPSTISTSTSLRSPTHHHKNIYIMNDNKKIISSSLQTISSTTSSTPSWSKLLSTYSIPIDVTNGDILTSPTKDLQYTRLFGQHESQCRIVFYRDHALWCPYCHKVQLLLELKQIPYTVKKINMSCYGKKNKEFLSKVPSGLLPVIELDGKIITESMDIMFLIEETFPSPKYKKTIPQDDDDMMQSFHKFMRLERLYMGAWIQCLRGSMGILDKGIKPVYHVLDLIEKCLNEFEGSYFYPGDLPSFIDINFSSLFERSRSSLKYWRNIDIIENRPNLQSWFIKWEQWLPSSYLKSDDWTHIGALPPQIGPVKFLKQRSQTSLFIEQSRNYLILNDGPEKQIERNIAASNLCRNSDIVVPDAIRGSKSSNQIEHDYIDLALRILAQVLFDPDLLEVLEDRLKTQIPQTSWKVVGDAVRFEKIRCCAPRDMPITSMEQFAGGINWILKTLEQEL